MTNDNDLDEHTEAALDWLAEVLATRKHECPVALGESLLFSGAAGLILLADDRATGIRAAVATFERCLNHAVTAIEEKEKREAAQAATQESYRIWQRAIAHNEEK